MSKRKFGLKARLECFCGEKWSTQISASSFVVDNFKSNILEFIDEHKNCESAITTRADTRPDRKD